MDAKLLAVLPLVFVMIAGPQIISAIFLATSADWARNSAALLVGAALSISAVITIAYLAFKGAKGGGGKSKGSEGHVLDVILLVLLLAAAVSVFRGRKESHPPKWMGRLQGANAKFAFILGFLLLGIFPTDILTSVTVGGRLAREGEPWWHALGFVLLTLILLALPALLVLLLGRRAQTVLPKVRDWMNTHSWVVSELVIALFVAIQLNSLFGS